jgi:hypothetical protein
MDDDDICPMCKVNETEVVLGVAMCSECADQIEAEYGDDCEVYEEDGQIYVTAY